MINALCVFVVIKLDANTFFQRTRCLQQCDAVDMTVSNEAENCPCSVRGAVACLVHQEILLCVPPAGR